jgi:DNA-binding XRE family transcriptional regulator
MSINKKALYALGTPENILFWLSESQRVLLIGGSPDRTPLSFAINNRYYKTKTGYKIALRRHTAGILREARKGSNTTQQQVADKAKINIRQYQMFENGERDISNASFKITMAVIEALEITPETLKFETF